MAELQPSHTSFTLRPSAVDGIQLSHCKAAEETQIWGGGVVKEISSYCSTARSLCGQNCLCWGASERKGIAWQYTKAIQKKKREKDGKQKKEGTNGKQRWRPVFKEKEKQIKKGTSHKHSVLSNILIKTWI